MTEEEVDAFERLGTDAKVLATGTAVGFEVHDATAAVLKS